MAASTAEQGAIVSERPDREPEGLRLLHDLMLRVGSSEDTQGVLDEIVHLVTAGLGYGVASIFRRDGDFLVLAASAGCDDVHARLAGRRTPVSLVLQELGLAERWGILRYVPHERIPAEYREAALRTSPGADPGAGQDRGADATDEDKDAWHAGDVLYAPLYSATGELLGNMAVDRPPGGRVPGPLDRELLELFMVQAGLALSHAQHRALLAEQVRLRSMMAELAVVGTQADLDHVLGVAARAVAEGLECGQVYVRCFPEVPAGPWEHAAGYPVPSPVQGGIKDLRTDLALLAEQGVDGPVAVELSQETSESLPGSLPELQEKMRRHGLVSAEVAQMRAGQDMLGYVVALRGAERPRLSEAEHDALGEMGRQLGRLVLDVRLRSTEQRLLAELQELDRYKGELIATISHELKTPLTSIIGHTELLEDGARMASSVAAIDRNAQRIQELVDNLLNYSRLQGTRETGDHEVDLRHLVASSLETLAMVAERAGVRLSYEPPARPVVVHGDPEELQRVTDNICSNAVKYSRGGGMVRVSLAVTDTECLMAVTDEGIGISRRDQARLFSAFHRSSNPDALSIPGTGLGLAIAKRIVELHDGAIEVDSVLGRGSTFTVRLPAPPSGSPSGPPSAPTG